MEEKISLGVVTPNPPPGCTAVYNISTNYNDNNYVVKIKLNQNIYLTILLQCYLFIFLRLFQGKTCKLNMHKNMYYKGE